MIVDLGCTHVNYHPADALVVCRPMDQKCVSQRIGFVLTNASTNVLADASVGSDSYLYQKSQAHNLIV